MLNCPRVDMIPVLVLLSSYSCVDIGDTWLSATQKRLQTCCNSPVRPRGVLTDRKGEEGGASRGKPSKVSSFLPKEQLCHKAVIWHLAPHGIRAQQTGTRCEALRGLWQGQVFTWLIWSGFSWTGLLLHGLLEGEKMLRGWRGMTWSCVPFSSVFFSGHNGWKAQSLIWKIQLGKSYLL